jgi:hypothetical protein
MNTVIKRVKSWFLGLIDYSYILITLYRGAKRPRYFRLGWGDLHEYRRVLNEFMKSFEEVNVPFDLHSKLEWEEPVTDGSLQITYGKFISPMAVSLPAESRLCNVCLVSPEKNPDAARVSVVMMPATGEQCYTNRYAMAKVLAERGWSSVIICAPYYGHRRPLLQDEDCHDTVTDYLLMNISIINEAALVVRHMLATGSDTVCVTGFSWGGAMAACTTVVASHWGADHNKIACVPYAGGANPAGFADGMLECTIDWRVSCYPPST